MAPSSTVEDYLKAIYQAQSAAENEHALIPTGQIASTLGVVPSAATTMVKTLAESGLVAYERHSGVRLTNAGEHLAAMVLRRHRLVELFLVQIMGMSWAEVHGDAEQLEHAVSDRLIDRIDELLGRPAVDPHGDPIPDSKGAVARHLHQSLLTCPVDTRIIVTRVLDQDADFLRFLEQHELKPGQAIKVVARDPAADSVSVVSHGNHRVPLGTGAASKLLVKV